MDIRQLEDNIKKYFTLNDCLIERQNIFLFLEFIGIAEMFDSNHIDLLWKLLIYFNEEKKYVSQTDCERVFGKLLKFISMTAADPEHSDMNNSEQNIEKSVLFGLED